MGPGAVNVINIDKLYRAPLVAQMVKSLPAMQKTQFNPWVRKILWRRAWQPTPVFLPGKSHGQRSLMGFSPGGHRKLDVTEVTEHSTGV